jgi:hypothetical protein
LLLEDSRALVTEIDLDPGQAYVVPQAELGSVWIALDPMTRYRKKHGSTQRRQIHPGATSYIRRGEQLRFLANGAHTRLILVHPKRPHQDLTLESWVLDTELVDGSDRGETLFVAISVCNLRDLRDLGDENESLWSKPKFINLRAGELTWVRPGIHRFKNLGPGEARFVTIEW